MVIIGRKGTPVSPPPIYGSWRSPTSVCRGAAPSQQFGVSILPLSPSPFPVLPFSPPSSLHSSPSPFFFSQVSPLEAT